MNKFKTSMLAVLVAVTVFFAGCNGQGAMSGGAKVATVDGTAISKADYDKTYAEFEKAFGMEKLSAENRALIGETIKQMTLNKLILQTMIYNEAAKAGLTVTDAEVKKYKEEKILTNDEMKAQFNEFLKENGMTAADFDEMIKDNLLLSKFMDVKGGEAVKVSETEVKAFYDKNPKQFELPDRIRASHILVKAVVPQMKQELREKNPKISDAELDKEISRKRDELKKKADELFAQVKANPAKFEQLAMEQSDDKISARQGGDLGLMEESKIDPTFWAAIEKTPKGQLVSNVVTTPFGFHVIKVTDQAKARIESFDEAKVMIQDYLSQQKKQAFLEQWAQQARSKATIVIEDAYRPKDKDNNEVAPIQADPSGAAPANGKS